MAAAAALGGGSRIPAAAEAPASPAPTELYAQAVKAMSDLPQPANVTFRMEGTGDGLQVSLTVIRSQVWLLIQAGSATSSWTLRHRTYDYQSEIVDVDGRRYVSGRSFFDPTWYGAFRALREGMLNAQDPAPPRATPGPESATPPPNPNLKTIGAISVIGPAIYRVEDRGPAACPNGNAGHALHLVSRTRDAQHQLSDVIVDLASLRFCMMRFGSPASLGFHGFVEQHYADVGGFWMVTDGVLDGSLRFLGIATHGGVWRYRLIDMRFPLSLPPEAFDPGAQ